MAFLQQTVQRILTSGPASQRAGDDLVLTVSTHYARLQGVIRNPNVGRKSDQSSFVNVAAALKNGVNAYNASTSDGEPNISAKELEGSLLQWSHSTYSAVRTANGNQEYLSKAFGLVSLEDAKELEIIKRSGKYNSEKAAIITEIKKDLPIVTLGAADWPAYELMKNKFVNEKRVNERKQKGKKEKDGSRPTASLGKEGTGDDTNTRAVRGTNAGKKTSTDHGVPATFTTPSKRVTTKSRKTVTLSMRTAEQREPVGNVLGKPNTKARKAAASLPRNRATLAKRTSGAGSQSKRNDVVAPRGRVASRVFDEQSERGEKFSSSRKPAPAGITSNKKPQQSSKKRNREVNCDDEPMRDIARFGRRKFSKPEKKQVTPITSMNEEGSPVNEELSDKEDQEDYIEEVADVQEPDRGDQQEFSESEEGQDEYEYEEAEYVYDEDDNGE